MTATSSWSGSTGSSASGCATSPPAAAPRSSPSSTSGGSRSTSTGCSPPTRRPRSSPPSTPRPRPASAPTSPRSAPAKGDALLVTDAVTSHRRHRAARRRLGHRRRLRRHPEVPRRRPRPGAVHDQRPRLRAPRREAALVVPRPRPARRLRRRGRRQGRPRTYHHTAPGAMVVSLHGGLTRILEEGLEAVWARHQEAGRRCCRTGSRRWASSCSPPRAAACPS